MNVNEEEAYKIVTVPNKIPPLSTGKQFLLFFKIYSSNSNAKVTEKVKLKGKLIIEMNSYFDFKRGCKKRKIIYSMNGNSNHTLGKEENELMELLCIKHKCIELENNYNQLLFSGNNQLIENTNQKMKWYKSKVIEI